ncbi:MAG: phosphoribosylaminoimidazolesuccinocarboxamide synthase, partial [Clostridiales bacterium]|nr:phosphoribosylaminoimidazolesuccinocarboxamide synthase [Clostridiales bacterium]
GKTKDIIANNDGTATFIFKDDVTSENGVFDPGANTSGEVKIEGMGKASMLLSRHFFPILKAAGIPTHDISFDIKAGTMTAHALKILPAEIIWRRKAWGSFTKTYGVEQGLPLNGLVEATLKSDALQDPRINREALITLGKFTPEQYDTCDRLIRKIGPVLEEELKKYGYELIDFKAEFGINANGEVMMADEVSGGIWRALKDGQPADPIECAKTICGEYYN